MVAEPEADTTVPKAGLAITFTHGSGVSSTPSSTMTYSRPPSAKPPMPLASVRDGTSTGASPLVAILSGREAVISGGSGGSV